MLHTIRPAAGRLTVLALIAACAVLSMPSRAHAQGWCVRMDGTCWLNLSTEGQPAAAAVFKASWASGVLNGLRGAPFVIAQGWADDPKDLVGEAEWNRRITQMESVVTKYSPGIRSSQIVEGLDVFYEDDANRRIQWFDAAWVVLRRIARDDDAKVDAMVLRLRQSASTR